MARNTRMVTRTIKEHRLTLKVADLNANEIKVIEILVSQQNSDKLFKEVINRICDEMGCTYLATVSDEMVETLYGMTEDAFREFATELPPRKTNDVEEEA